MNVRLAATGPRSTKRYVKEDGHVSREAIRADRFARVLSVSIVLYVPLWLLGLGGLYWPMVTVPAVVYLVGVKLEPISAFALLIGATLLASIPVGYFAYQSDLSRVISAIGTCTPWIVLAAGVNALRHTKQIERIARNLAILGTFQAVVVSFAIFRYPNSVGLPIELPLSLPSGLASFASQRIYYQDWLGGEAFRTIGIMGNPTWAGAFSVIAAAAGIWLLRHSVSRITGLLAILSSPIAAYYSLSRSLWVALSAGLLVGILIVIRRRSSLLFAFSTALVLIGAMIFLLLDSGSLLLAIQDLNDDRAGSLESRSAIYMYTMEGIKNHPLPILGYGLKPQIEGLVASLATHSTYLGMLFRGGILATGFLILFLIALGKKVFLSHNALGSIILVFIATWAVLEDLDSGNLVMLGVFLCLNPSSEPEPC